LLKEFKSNEILKKWDESSNRAIKPKKLKKKFEWSQYDPKTNSKSPKSNEQLKKNNGIAFSGCDEQPKAYLKPEPKLMVIKPASILEPPNIQQINEKNNQYK
jgi:hypothetical protein